MTEHRSLRVTAIMICIIAVLIAALSGLCSIGFAASAKADIIAFFAIGAIGFVPFGVLAFAMFRHIKRGPNLATEIITFIMGLVLMLAGLFLLRFVVGSPNLVNLLFAIPGGLIVGWAIWSFKARSQPRSEASNDPFS